MKKLGRADQNTKSPHRAEQEETPLRPRLKRIRVLVLADEKRWIQTAAKRENVTVSLFVERAVREILSQTEKARGRRSAMRRLPPPTLRSKKVSLSPFREVKIVTVGEQASRSSIYGVPTDISKLWERVIKQSQWYHEDKEHLVSFSLDTKFKLKSFYLVSLGSLNESLAHPREVFRPAIADAASSVIVAHNHPSGDPHPSFLDRQLTERLFAAGELLLIPLLDHIIIGSGTRNYFSFREFPAFWPAAKRFRSTACLSPSTGWRAGHSR